jgi:hypothetical protein
MRLSIALLTPREEAPRRKTQHLTARTAAEIIGSRAS